MAVVGHVVSFYLVAYPVMYVLVFRYNQGVFGLWIALMLAYGTKMLTSVVNLYMTDWEKEAKLASQENRGRE